MVCFNAARSIVCVETRVGNVPRERDSVSMPHAALCVSRQVGLSIRTRLLMFQCRTQHCVCRDDSFWRRAVALHVSMPHAALCVSRPVRYMNSYMKIWSFNAARSIVCVETIKQLGTVTLSGTFQCRTQHCVCRDRK